ncbi:MAG: ABC transporter ATP-binding protein [Bacteroidota bacterium]
MKHDIIIEGVSKSFGDIDAVRNIQLSVEEGELFGLIGPDGAGKSTLFRILTSLLQPDGGRAIVAGLDTVKDMWAIRSVIGYMPGRFSLYQDLSIEENLDFFATIFNTSLAENYELIEEIYVQIEPFKKRRAGKLSGGMKQKLALCCALIHKPKVLFLDEPTTGVDAVSRAEFWEMLKRLKAHGISIMVSTPYMDEASLCDRIALIQGGEIMALDSPEDIIRGYDKPLFEVRTEKFYQLLLDLRAADFTERVEAFGEFLHLTTAREIAEREITAYLSECGHTHIEIRPAKANIEDVFLDLM